MSMTTPTPHAEAVEAMLPVLRLMQTTQAAYTDFAEAAIRAYLAAMAAKGWRMVPRVPTPAMMNCVWPAQVSWEEGKCLQAEHGTALIYPKVEAETCAGRWALMYDAAPPPDA